MSNNLSIMDEVCRAVGFDAVMRIVAMWGGVSLYVPAVMTPTHPIARDIGLDDAERLAQRFPNEIIQIPKLDYSYLRQRNNIRMLKQKGLRAVQIAAVMGMSERQVHRVLAEDHA